MREESILPAISVNITSAHLGGLSIPRHEDTEKRNVMVHRTYYGHSLRPLPWLTNAEQSVNCKASCIL